MSLSRTLATAAAALNPVALLSLTAAVLARVIFTTGPTAMALTFVMVPAVTAFAIAVDIAAAISVSVSNALTTTCSLPAVKPPPAKSISKSVVPILRISPSTAVVPVAETVTSIKSSTVIFPEVLAESNDKPGAPGRVTVSTR